MALSGRARSTRGVVILLVTLSLVTITVDYRQPDGPLARAGEAALTLMAPLQEAVAAAARPIGRFFSALAHLPSLEEENRRLREQIKRFEYEQIQAREALEENDKLRKELEIKGSLHLDAVGARVIASAPSNFEWSVNIDRGSRDGVVEGMPVIAAEGLVGRVVRVSPFGSTVLLIQDPQSQAAGRLIGSQETGLLRGRGDQALRMEFLIGTPVDAIEVDEPVVTVGYTIGGESSAYPEGIPIGKVIRVEELPGTSEAVAFVEPNVNVSSLDFVLVVEGIETR
jgi:rod shape-determining protein MreC